jgi:late competence protein required for DNA uptake (superfamily II DNA/RNA helicase)
MTKIDLSKSYCGGAFPQPKGFYDCGFISCHKEATEEVKLSYATYRFCNEHFQQFKDKLIREDKPKRCFKCQSTRDIEEYPLDASGGGAVGVLYFCRTCLRRGEAEEDRYL